MNDGKGYQLIQMLQEFTLATQRYVDSAAASHHTHPTDLKALAVIMGYERAGKSASPKDLSRELHLSSPATTALLDRLERLGHVRRERSTADRRALTLAPTQAAREHAGGMFRPLSARLLELVDSLEGAEQEFLKSFLARAVAGVESARQDLDGGGRNH